MKSKVDLSVYSMIISSLSLAVLAGVLVYSFKQPDNVVAVNVLVAIVAVLCVSTLLYLPLSISSDGDFLQIHRPLRAKRIPVSEIASVRLWQPTMGERRIFGSGGWFGYYGWFSERDLGKYFAYYGKSSDCFLVTLRSGRKYVLGCRNPRQMVDHLRLMTDGRKTPGQ